MASHVDGTQKKKNIHQNTNKDTTQQRATTKKQEK